MKSSRIFTVLIVIIFNSSIVQSNAPKIAVIGGGIGGSAFTFFLKKSLPNSLVTLYEPQNIGGRLKTVKIANRDYECGGSIIHPKNQLMKDLVAEMNLKPRPPGPDSRFTMINKDGVVFQQTSWSYLQPLQMIYRYGLFTLIKLHYFIKGMLEDFSSIYPFLNQGSAVEKVEDMLRVMSPTSRKNRSQEQGMLNMLQESLQTELLRQSLPQNLIDELVTAAVRTNYGQMAFEVHAFVGSVALAGAEGQLWSIEGGNHVLAEKLLHASGAGVLPEHVNKISKNADGTYNVLTKETNKTYDIVVLATPMTEDTQTMKLEGLEKPPNFTGKYHQTVATLVHGNLNPKYFGLTQETMTDTIFFVDSTLNVNSVSLLSPTNFQEGQPLPQVWKVFSQRPLTEKDLQDIFTEKTETQICDWLAYPSYSTNQTLSDFVIDENLYHINAIEWSASAMEMSVLGAKNVANLIAQKYGIKQENSTHSTDEL